MERYRRSHLGGGPSNRRVPAVRAKQCQPKLSLHGLRHTWAMIALLPGIHPCVVQECRGHATIGITLGTYSHVTAGMGREAADSSRV